MNKYFISVYILSLLIHFQNNNDYIDDLLENYDLKYEESLKNFLKNYLIEKKLLESDELIKPDEFKQIFIDMMLEGTPPDEVDDYANGMNEELARIFIQKYYKRKKEIRGKDIYDLINIKEIKDKLYQLNGEIPFYDEDDFGNYNNDL